MKIALSIGATIFVLIAVLVGTLVSNANYGNRAEQQIKAEYTNMENILSAYTLKVTEAAQVPTMMKDDVKDIMSGIMSGRYGGDGSKAMFQFIKEQNPSVDAAMYTKIQTIIEGGRDKFENAQTKFIDTKRTYVTNLGSIPKKWFLSMAGYPSIDLDDYAIISNDQTRETFRTKTDNGVKLR